MIIKQENTKSLTRSELRSCIVGSTANEANEFIIIAFCYERAVLVAVLMHSKFQLTLKCLVSVFINKLNFLLTLKCLSFIVDVKNKHFLYVKKKKTTVLMLITIIFTSNVPI